MNRTFVSFCFVCAVVASAPAFAKVGVIQEILGDATVTRDGLELPSIDIGDSIENFDLIKTGPDGLVVVELDRSSGMSGTLTVKPKSVFTVKSETVRGVPSTEGELIGGAVSVKVKRLSGEPAFRVRTTSTVMGVRGTEFDVVVSVNDSLLVGCYEGRVACTGEEGDEIEATPGYAVERTSGERLRRVPVAVSSLAAFRDQWIVDEIDVFKASPLTALDLYARTYRRYRDEFRAAYKALSEAPAFAVWAAERRKGVVPRSNDIAVMKQKSSMAPKLMEMRRVMFLFERVYYRLDEVRSYVGDAALRTRLPSGGTVQEFYREYTQEQAELARKAAAYRFALSLYAERNEGREPVPMGAGSDEDFFGDDGFFD